MQFVVSPEGEVSVIELTRSSRTVLFISCQTGYPIADIATYCMLGRSLKEQGIFVLYPEEKKRCYVSTCIFLFQASAWIPSLLR